ncbi:dTDP-4-amino-4,6-dideoxygalactose transaminase [Candidatus Electrothrix aarhusensis]|uniref:dTDP-4-amino-4,6-dideoxygalactose transaminase n=1 Tax=Candidatus Electrothrix aarhusensis TaxID=1859131 RepID=A0A444IUJ4_9BACT|nr:dTDP-4-amino-4,6-dideoxygalactose transaminase [Candidatus Electrothrix aarhusensis]
MPIPFNKPFIVGKELYYIAQAVLEGHIAGDGSFTRKCHALLEKKFNASKVLLTHSCTAALEIAALLCDIQPGDEVILPSFTFVSTANAFCLRGAKPVFVDIRPDTLNINEKLIEEAITDRTKVIVPVHYAGVGCEMETIMEIAGRHGLFVVEDAAQGVSSQYKGKYLGTIGDLGTYSFHETKNFISGEGGALVINNERFIERAEIIREKGTDRSKFFRGEVDKYTWVDLGSSYLPSEIVAAFLYAQLEHIDTINQRRQEIFNYYQQGLQPLAGQGLLQIPHIPPACNCNNHLFYILLPDEQTRDGLMAHLKNKGIYAVFHYLPLHLSKMGKILANESKRLPITESISKRLLRLPCYYELTAAEQECVVKEIEYYFSYNE